MLNEWCGLVYLLQLLQHELVQLGDEEHRLVEDARAGSFGRHFRQVLLIYTSLIADFETADSAL